MTNQTDNSGPILCGTDFSPVALESVEIAANIAKRLSTKLVLVHVSSVRELQKADPALFEAAIAGEQAELERDVTRLRKTGAEIESQFRIGSPFDELVTAAIETSARLIVVGAIGHGLARRLLIGSVAERTAEISPVPTLVIRPGGRLLPWIQGKHPLRILVGYDFSPASDAALRWVSQLREIGPCEISVVHLDWPPGAAAKLGYKGPLPLTENPAEIQKPLEQELQKRVDPILSSGTATLAVRPAWGTPESCLFEISHQENTDLIVLGTHQRVGLGRIRFGSVSRSVLHHAKVSVVVVPPPEVAIAGSP